MPTSAGTSSASATLLRAIDRVEHVVDMLLSIVAVAVLVVMAALVFVAVVMRYGFGSPLIFSYDLSTMLFAWIVFLGLFIAERDGALLSVDLVQPMAEGPLRTGLLVVRQIILILLTAYLTWVSARLLMRTGMQIPSLRISVRWLYASLPAGFAALTAIYVLRFPRLLLPRAD